MAGTQSGPDRHPTSQPAARDAEQQIGHVSSTGLPEGSPIRPDYAYIRASELVDPDPAATVATAAVHASAPATSAPPASAHQQPAWPGSAPDSRAHGFASGVTSGVAPSSSPYARAQRQTSIPVYHPDSDELPGDMYGHDEDLAEGMAERFADSGFTGNSFTNGFSDPLADDYEDDIPDETDDEWSVADQPTAAIRHRTLADAQGAAHERSARPEVLGGPRLASPDGALMPMTPPTGIPLSALANPRMERFQELREQRKAHERGERAPHDSPPVNERVRTWWMDLTPGLQRALKLQHEARESGTHAVPGYVVTVASAMLRMTDAFGRLAVSTRELANRAHATAGPALRRVHESAEAYAQALIEKLEGTPVQQQAAFLGPGRLAVLFKSGVTVGQAQRLLQHNEARPLRLIPRKHGFLALVQRGMEAEVADRLKQHPYVRDVIYMEYDDPSQSLSTEVPAIMGARRM